MKKLFVLAGFLLTMFGLEAQQLDVFYGDIKAYGNIVCINNPLTTRYDSSIIPYLYVDSINIGGVVLTKDYIDDLGGVPDSIKVTYLSSEDSIVGKNLAVDSINCYAITIGDSTVTFITRGDTLLTYERALELLATQQIQIDSKKVYHGIEAYGTLSFDDGTHIFTMGAGLNKYWYKGDVFSTTSAITCDLDAFVTVTANTLYFVYFDDETGVLTANTSSWNLKSHCPVTLIYWNGTSGAIGLETHNHTRNIDWHINAHLTIGTRYTGGYDIVNPTVSTDNDLDISGGTIMDEDIANNHSAQSNARHFYQVSAGVYTWINSDLPYIGTIGVPQYLNTGTYTLTNVGSNNYSNYWVYSSNDIDRNIYIIPMHSTTVWNTIVSARGEGPPDLLGLGLDPEMKLLYRFIYNGNGSFEEYEDFRRSSSLPSGGSTAVTASSVTFIPYGSLISTDVQGVISELEDQKANIGDTSVFVQSNDSIRPKSATKLGVDNIYTDKLEVTGKSRFILTVQIYDSLGVGVDSVEAPLHVSGNKIIFDRFSGTSSGSLNIQMRRARGTEESPSVLFDGDHMSSWANQTWIGSDWEAVGSLDMDYVEWNSKPGTMYLFSIYDTIGDTKNVIGILPNSYVAIGSDNVSSADERLHVKDGNLKVEGHGYFDSSLNAIVIYVDTIYSKIVHSEKIIADSVFSKSVTIKDNQALDNVGFEFFNEQSTFWNSFGAGSNGNPTFAANWRGRGEPSDPTKSSLALRLKPKESDDAIEFRRSPIGSTFLDQLLWKLDSTLNTLYVDMLINGNFTADSATLAFIDSVKTRIVQIGEGTVKLKEDNNNLRIEADTTIAEGHIQTEGTVFAYKFVQAGYNDQDLDLYIAPQTGSDETGDGSIGNPYKSMKGCLSSLEPIQDGAVKIYYIESGTEQMTQEVINLFGDINWTINVKVYGDTAIVRDDFLTSGFPDSDNTWVKKAVSNPGGTTMSWGENTYRGNLIRLDNYAPDYKLDVIGNHDDSTLSCAGFLEGWWSGAICSIEDTLHFPTGLFGTSNGLTETRKIIFYNFYVTYGAVTGKFTEEMQFSDCVIKQTTNNVIKNYGSSLIDILILSDNTNKQCLINQQGYTAEYTTCQLIQTNPESAVSGNYALEFTNGTAIVQRMRIIGFPQVFRMRLLSNIGAYYGHYPNQFENCGVIWTIDGSGSSFVDGILFGVNKIRLFNVNYLFSLNGGDEALNYTFEEGKIVNWDDSLEYDVFVPSTGGQWQSNPTALPALQSKPNKYIDPIKQVSFYVYGLIYPEIDNGSMLLLSNDTTDIVIGRNSQNLNIKLTYSCERNNDIQFGEINVINYTDSLLTSPEFNYGNDIGLSFAPTVFDNDSIVLKPILTDAGFTADFVFDVKRIMK